MRSLFSRRGKNQSGASATIGGTTWIPASLYDGSGGRRGGVMILTEEMERTLRKAWEEAKKRETNLYLGTYTFSSDL